MCVCGCLCIWACVYCISLSPPPLYLISASVHHQEGEERSVRQLFIVYRIGILWVFPGRKKTHTTEQGGKSFQQKGLKCLSTAKFGLLIFSNSCCSFIVTNKVNQTNHDAPAANYVLIYCVIATSAAKALCIFAGI